MKHNQGTRGANSKIKK